MSKKQIIYLSKKSMHDLVEPYDLKDVLSTLKKNKMIDAFQVLKYTVVIEASQQKHFEIATMLMADSEPLQCFRKTKKSPC